MHAKEFQRAPKVKLFLKYSQYSLMIIPTPVDLDPKKNKRFANFWSSTSAYTKEPPFHYETAPKNDIAGNNAEADKRTVSVRIFLSFFYVITGEAAYIE